MKKALILFIAVLMVMSASIQVYAKESWMDDYELNLGYTLGNELVGYATENLLSTNVRGKLTAAAPGLKSSDIKVENDKAENKYGVLGDHISAEADGYGVHLERFYDIGYPTFYESITFDKEAFKYFPDELVEELAKVDTLARAMEYFSHDASPIPYSDEELAADGYFMLWPRSFLDDYDQSLVMMYYNDQWHFTGEPDTDTTDLYGMFKPNEITVYYCIFEQFASSKQWNGCGEFDIKLVYSKSDGDLEERKLEKVIFNLEVTSDEPLTAPPTGDGIPMLIALAAVSAVTAVTFRRRVRRARI